VKESLFPWAKDPPYAVTDKVSSSRMFVHASPSRVCRADISSCMLETHGPRNVTGFRQKSWQAPKGDRYYRVLEVWKTKAVVRWIRFRDGQQHVELWVSQQLPLLYLVCWFEVWDVGPQISW